MATIKRLSQVNGIITEQIYDENDNVVGEVSINSNDDTLYPLLTEVSSRMQKLQEEYKVLIEPSEPAEEFESAKDFINRLKGNVKTFPDRVADICVFVDEIFGVGISDLFLFGSRNVTDLTLLIPLIEPAVDLLAEKSDPKLKLINQYKRKANKDVMQ